MSIAPATATKTPFLDCQIDTLPSGEGAANITIPADIMRRLRTRAGDIEMGEYVWTNVIKPALFGHCY